MPRRNFHLLWIIVVVALACHLRVDRFGRLLASTMNQIGQRYLEDVDQDELFEGAVEGMLNRLDEKYDDKNSAYISPADVQGFEEMLNQHFGGVGMEVGMPEGSNQLTVMSPLPGSPAYEAGILAGDKILKIDGRSTQGLSIQQGVERLRGKVGDPVTLTVVHEGETQGVEISIVRAVIQVKTVLGDMRNPDGSWNFFLPGHDRIGYLRITSFAENTADEMREALQWLVDRQMRGLILDLRNDPGGFLDEAVEVCDMFVDSGTIVTTRRRHGMVNQLFEARAPSLCPDVPMAVIINQRSASASEIVAACLQDHGRAVVVGQRTFGKGTIQELINLAGDHGMLKLTTASYWRPSGKNINRGKGLTEKDEWGVRPDEGQEVIVEGEALRNLALARRRRDVFKPPAANGAATKPEEKQPPSDPQLNRAIEDVENRIKAEPGS